LGLGSEARMNCPAKQLDDWEWKATFEQLAANKFELLKELTATSGRTL
jgi:hypothetical protein